MSRRPLPRLATYNHRTISLADPTFTIAQRLINIDHLIHHGHDVGAARTSIALFSDRARPQGASQAVGLVKVDLQKLSAGYRPSKVIDSKVVNDADKTIGKIDAQRRPTL